MEYSVNINGQMACQPNAIDRGEGNDVIQDLAKLKGLKKDDKTENAMLRSRIDEQSQLIMILKGRADEAMTRTNTLDKIIKEHEEFRENAQENLAHEIRKFNMLDARFNELAANHEEIIKFKDQYKRVNADLRAENDKLREDNEKLFSKAIQDRDMTINNLEGKLTLAKDQCAAIDTKYRHSVQEARSREETLRNEIKTLQDKLKSDTKTLQQKLNDTEERLKAANYKLQNQIDSRQNADVEAQTRIQQLTKEKDELLDLAMQRGKIIQKEQTENKQLKKRVEEMEKAVRNMEEKFEREAAAVNSNRQVVKLRDELKEAETHLAQTAKEFDAYKKHTSGLLKKEKELNERLRHLCG